MQAPWFRAERGVGEEGARRLGPSAPGVRAWVRAPMRLGGRAPPLRSLPSASAGSRTRGSAGQRCPVPRKWPRTLGDSLVAREPVGLHPPCASLGRVGHLCRLASLGTGVGWAPGPPKLAQRPLRPGKGTFPATSASAVLQPRRKARCGHSPGAGGAPASRGICESPWEIPGPSRPRLPLLPPSGEAVRLLPGSQLGLCTELSCQGGGEAAPKPDSQPHFPAADPGRNSRGLGAQGAQLQAPKPPLKLGAPSIPVAL